MEGEQLESLAGYIAQYNSGLLGEKEGRERKERASKAILALLKTAREHDITLNGFRVQVLPWRRETISLDHARLMLPEDTVMELVQISSGLRLDVRPTRELA